MTPQEIIVVGSGLGGLTAALRASALGHAVTLVTKGALDESNSRWAQGGIAAATAGDDAPALHVADTMVAGAGLSVLEAVEVLCSDGPARIDDLVRWGVRFDVEPSGEWSRGLEAAHSRSRVLHAGGDATGAAIVRALIDTLRGSDVTVVEHAFLTDLLTVPGEAEAPAACDGGRGGEQTASRAPGDAHGFAPAVVGVELLVGGARTRLRADAVVLATGGAGQLYEHTTNPAGATADGLAAAWRSGAQVDDLEFYQFHPTALAAPSSFLISEAVRGEGAVLLDLAGHRFMAAVDRRAELAPRDVVARGIADLMARQAGLPALLDATGLGRATLERRFPTITAATRAAGFDWATDPIPVTPAAHYFMGGVSTDLGGRTTLPGLYAVGEVASTGVHGANRLASNSLLEAAVFGWRVVETLGQDARAGLLRHRPLSEAETPAPVDDAEVHGGSRRPLARAELQRLMWAGAGVERSGDVLAETGALLEDATAPGVGSCAADGRDAVGAADAAGTVTADAAADGIARLETGNLLQVGRLVVASAASRTESRGAHYRTDYPEPTETTPRHTTWTREAASHAHR